MQWKLSAGTWNCLTGDGHGDVLADDKLFSTSSGKSTEPVFSPRVAYKSFLWFPGLDGAEKFEMFPKKFDLKNYFLTHNAVDYCFCYYFDYYSMVAYTAAPNDRQNHRDEQPTQLADIVAHDHAIPMIQANLNSAISCEDLTFDVAVSVELL